MADDNSLADSDQHPSLSFGDVIESSRVIAETASDAIISIDENSTILFVNRAATNIFGYSFEEMMGANLTMLMPEYLRHLHRAGLQNYIETGKRHISWEAVELPGRHKSGKEITLELSFGEFIKNGRRFFTGIARDISKRKHDERRLALQHSIAEILTAAEDLDDATPQLLRTICTNLDWQFAALWSVDETKNLLQLVTNWRDGSTGTAAFEATSQQLRFPLGEGFPGHVWAKKEAVWVADFAAGNFPRSSVAARDNLHSAFGFPISLGDEVLGVIELFSVNVKDHDPLNLDTLAAIGSQIGQFVERKRGERDLVEALSHAHQARLEAETVSGHLSSLQRITDAALAHLSVDEVIAESLKRVRDVLSVDTVAILLLEAEGDELLAWAAHGLEEELELGVRIPVGKGFAGKIVSEKKPLVIEDITKADIYNPLILEKGIKSLLGVPLLIEGRPIGVIHVGTLQPTRFTAEYMQLLQRAADRIALAIENARLHEVERSARAEAEAANTAKDEFLTILSHELRTPLTPIIGWIHMMQSGILPEADFSKVLSVMNRNAYSLKRLINDLLDMSAILSRKMRIEEQLVSISGVLEESVETMRPYASDSKVQIRLKTNEDAKALAVTGDRSRLNQTFCNILHNAIKFSPPGSQVQVAMECDAEDVIVRVKDHGKGIPTAFLPHVFERFRQADGSRTRVYGGLGLGLALVKSFVEAHKGTVEVTSEGEGKGSTFTVRLPREVPASQSDAACAGSADIGRGRRVRVLLVEDQPDTLEMLTAILETRGYEVIACSSAQHALNTIEEKNFDVLISDLAMPGMDGFELIRKIRQRKDVETKPAIALTGYASQNDADAAMQAGFDLHLSKPVEPSELADAVDRLAIGRGDETERVI
jgi:PAS domain S-box-containing protein